MKNSNGEATERLNPVTYQWAGLSSLCICVNKEVSSFAVIYSFYIITRLLCLLVYIVANSSVERTFVTVV